MQRTLAVVKVKIDGQIVACLTGLDLITQVPEDFLKF